MINLSTPNEELLDELKSDEKKAEYWLTKHIGGERKMADKKQNNRKNNRNNNEVYNPRFR